MSLQQEEEDYINESRRVIFERTGQVLGKGTIVKLDQYAFKTLSSSLLHKEIPLSGAPNFRKTANNNVYGVGQPTLFGIKTILNHIYKTAKQVHGNTDKVNIIWINLREEPIIYINKRPFVLREMDHPFSNFGIYAGVQTHALEEMESRLKTDILQESLDFDDNFLVHDETENNVAVPCWEAVSAESVQTPKDVFQQLIDEGYKVTYIRVPVTPDQPFKEIHYDTLFKVLMQTYNSQAVNHIVYNCQLGFGRSTVGTVIANLIHMHMHGDTKVTIDARTPLESKGALRHGDYHAVVSLIRLLENGEEIKAQTDAVIDKCGSYINLRHVILHLKERFQTAAHSAGQVFVHKAAQALERYFFLIAFNAFLYGHQQFRKENSEEAHPYLTFSEWMNSRGELFSIIEQIREHPEEQLNTELRFNLRNSGRTLPMSFPGSSVLSKGVILKADHVTLAIENHITGAPNYRKILDEPIYAVGSSTVSGITEVLREIARHEKNLSQQNLPLYWINMREEPIVYIKNRPFVLREFDHPFHSLKAYAGMSAERVQSIEERIQSELKKEMVHFGGKVFLHDEISDKEIVSLWEQIEDDAQYDFHITYKRVPLIIGKSPSEQDFDMLLDLFDSTEENARVVFSCQMGRGRSTLGMVIYYLLSLCRKKVEIIPMNVSPKKYEYKPILNVLRVLPQGQYRRQQVDKAIDMCGSVYNLREKIDDLRDEYFEARTESESTVISRRIATFLERYFWLIVLNTFLAERSNGKTKGKFSEWVKERPEIKTVLDGLRTNKDHVFRAEGEDKTSSLTIIKRRNGDVLGHGTILKSDHFPGCQRMNLLPHIPGAPNFRQVSPDLHIYGVAIPTIEGMQNVLKYIGSDVGSHNKRVIWTSMREEPVVYINNRPFVLRNYDDAFSNLEYTGIDTTRVEEMEERLKNDILAEASLYNGEILVHDETPDFKIVEMFETASKETVLTPKDVYNSLAKQGYPVDYKRIAITDEQAPEEKDFDDLLQTISDPSHTRLIFNCQMGRGRTTTGLVLATLLAKLQTKQLPQMNIRTPDSTPTIPRHLSEANLSQQALMQYHKGEYKVILRLIRVLQNGLQRKLELDYCIDLCSHMQNLRQDIAALKEKADNLQGVPKQREVAHERGINYLKRYFLLIAFNAYLREQKGSNNNYAQTFETWMKEHRELYSLLDHVELN